MKRGKDDEKIMEPMFPRLHVNDTDKGGSRAPPKNKMALYKQLTIPSQRYNFDAAPPRQNSTSTSNLVPFTSTSQGTCGKRKAYFSLYQPPSAPAYEEIQDLNTEAINLNNQPIHVEEKKKSLEEDDFMVPIFFEGQMELHNEKIQNSNDREGRHCPNSNNQTVLPTTLCKETNQSHDIHLVLNQLIKDRDGRKSYNWEKVLEGICNIRSSEDAPVDSMGCDKAGSSCSKGIVSEEGSISDEAT